MRVELTLSANDPSLHALRDAWLGAGDRFAGDTATLAHDARAMHAALADRDIPPALRDVLALVPRVADLVTDDGWLLTPEQRRDFVGALAYFIDNDDLIPDNVGRYGYLDDALVIRLALQSSAQEWQDWNDYRQFRDTYPALADVDRDQWQRDRDVLIDRMVKLSHRPRSSANDDAGERSYGTRGRASTRFNIR
ncbi:YkvA family protein [Chiayiivirga flava]|uniref:DUF1232 domain-containing protein n=1 Tax=Chiayiivirga flava TaxID=659595 RepID=A0A7W8G298_9GAMM|nr:YkvA family protein [Chiayiivirga flava]MBB5208475.1 hypothetical protein [Chiayiivirga flava]